MTLVWVEFESGHGIWEELKSYRSVALSHSVFNVVAVDIAQFGHAIHEQVAKIHCRFVVHNCDLHSLFSCCHAVNKLDSSAVLRRP